MKRYLPTLSVTVLPVFVACASYLMCVSGQLNMAHIFLLG